MPIFQSKENIISIKTSASLLVEYIYYAINTILFIRGFSTLNNFTLQFPFGTPIWILNDEKLTHCFKPQLKSLREMLVNRFVRKIFLYLKSSTTNEVIERWDFVVECKEHYHSGLPGCDLYTIQNEIRDVLQQICTMSNFLPVLTREWKYTITVKLEEPLMSNVETLKIPKSWFKTKNSKKTQYTQTLYWDASSQKPFVTAVNYKRKYL